MPRPEALASAGGDDVYTGTCANLANPTHDTCVALGTARTGLGLVGCTFDAAGTVCAASPPGEPPRVTPVLGAPYLSPTCHYAVGKLCTVGAVGMP